MVMKKNRTMIKQGIVLFLAVFLFFAQGIIFGGNSLIAQQKTKVVAPPKLKEKDLPQQYQDWLNLVSYIILPGEKDVFLRLANERDRDIFIETFWKHRDPTPATPQNEYKDEHIKRFNYANSFYRRGATRPGWMTDMGRMYIILGEPVSIERFEGVTGIFPAQVWYYYGDQAKRLPNYFAVVFYQRGGSGEFKLYNPAADGPASLLIDSKGVDLTDSQQLYQKIKDLAPTLAGVSISMIPGQYPYNNIPSPQSNIILADIFNSPKKDINPAYATHFLDYKTMVSTEYLTNFVESSACTALVEEPSLGIRFLHFSISPKKMSIDYFQPKDQYYCSFKLNVSLRSGEKIIYQYSKDFPFYFPQANVENIQGNGIAIQDSFPVIEGRYGLTILLQNSVGKEFSIFEKEVVVPEAATSPKIIGPLLGYKLQDERAAVHAPFKVLDKQISVDPTNTIAGGDDLAIFFNISNMREDVWKLGQVEVGIKGSQEKAPVQKTLSLKLSDYPYARVMGISSTIPAREFSPDYYQLTLTLNDGTGKVIDEASSPFIVSPSQAIPHPVTLAKSFPLSNDFLYYYSLAYQYDKMDLPGKAEADFSKALELQPDYAEGIVEYANFLLRGKKYQQSLDMIERIGRNEKLRFDYFLVRGLAEAGMGQFAAAIGNLLEGNKIYNSDTRLLNSLGFCYSKTGQKKEALEVLNASLRLNPDQPDVKALKAEIEKNKQ